MAFIGRAKEPVQPNIMAEVSSPSKKSDFGIVELQTLLFFLSHGKWLAKEVKFAGNILMDRFRQRAQTISGGYAIPGNADRASPVPAVRAPRRLRLASRRYGSRRFRGIAFPDADLADSQLFLRLEHRVSPRGAPTNFPGTHWSAR